jgi:hypothetical protein
VGWLSWARFVARRPFAVACLGTVQCLLGGLVAWGRLELETARARYVWGGEDRLLTLVAFREELAGQRDPRTASVEAASRLIAELAPAWPDVPAGLTGKPVLEVHEMATDERDSVRSSAVALESVTEPGAKNS